MIIWGRRTKVAQAGNAGMHVCGYCHRQAYFARLVQYSSHHINWIVRWATGRRIYVTCGNCGVVQHADLSDQNLPEVRNAIPFWDRRSWMVFAGAIFVLGFMPVLFAV